MMTFGIPVGLLLFHSICFLPYFVSPTPLTKPLGARKHSACP